MPLLIVKFDTANIIKKQQTKLTNNVHDIKKHSNHTVYFNLV